MFENTNTFNDFCLFTILILYFPVNNFSVLSEWVFLGCTKQRITCLAQGHNTVPPVRLEHATPRSTVQHSTTESLRPLRHKHTFNEMDKKIITIYRYIGLSLVTRNLTKVLTSMCIACACGQSDQRLYFPLIEKYMYNILTCFIQNFNILANLCSLAGWLVLLCWKPLRRGTYGPRHQKKCLRGFVNYKNAYQPAHPLCLISALVIRLLQSSISRLNILEISIF